MRRGMTVLAGMVALCCADTLRGADQGLLDPGRLAARPVVAIAAQPVELSRVRLLDGPFKAAQELDHQYLLALDVERMLHVFRLNAGLPTTAQALGGWESPETELRGHFVGHYLSGASLMYAATGDEKLREKVRALVAGLAECQAKLGESGYLSAFPETYIDRVEKGEKVWAPYYTLHKILAGLLDAAIYCGDKQAMDVARKMGDWVASRNAKLDDPHMQAMLRNEHGGMNEVMANLYALTGDRKYLDSSIHFNHHLMLDPASQGKDNLTGFHANTQVPKFIGHARQYELNGDEALRKAATFFWNTVVHERSYVIGGHSDGEMFSDKAKLSTAFGPSTTETCNTYNMLKLTRHLFAWDPKVEYSEYTERALINHILASQNPKTGMMCYYVPLKPGSHKEYNAPNDSFWCCTGTGVENHAKYGDSIYWLEGADTLVISQFIASELDWKEKGVKVRMTTDFPASGQVKVQVECQQPSAFQVVFRHPSWVDAKAPFQAQVNGQDVAPTAPGTWVKIDRKWDKDEIALAMPFGLRTEGFRDNPNRLAFLDGPVVLAAPLANGAEVPAIVLERGEAKEALERKPAGKGYDLPASVLRIAGEKVSRPLGLLPFYKVYGDQAYTVYFDVFTPAAWESHEEAHRAEVERRKALDRITLDLVTPGEEQVERDHKATGEKDNAGPFGPRHYRHATDGGWFSWELATKGKAAIELWVTYWGDDAGNREFDVLANGEKIATERLHREQPGEFFVRKYVVPKAVLEGAGGKPLVVRFQAHPGNFAGGVFEVRAVEAGQAP